MKSRRAEQVLQAASFTNEYGYQYVCIDSAYAAVELAEQDAEKEVTHYRKESEESKQHEKLARTVIEGQRKEIEKQKERAIEAFKDHMIQNHGGYLSSDLYNFIQKLNER